MGHLAFYQLYQKFINKTSFFEDMIFKHQCGFRKNFNTQQCLLKSTEEWENVAHKGKPFVAQLTSLSKVCDCLNHEVLIVKLNRQALTLPALRLIHNYLSNKKQGASKSLL